MQHTPFQDKYDTCEKKRKIDNYKICGSQNKTKVNKSEIDNYT